MTLFYVFLNVVFFFFLMGSVFLVKTFFVFFFAVLKCVCVCARVFFVSSVLFW